MSSKPETCEGCKKALPLPAVYHEQARIVMKAEPDKIRICEDRGMLIRLTNFRCGAYSR